MGVNRLNNIIVLLLFSLVSGFSLFLAMRVVGPESVPFAIVVSFSALGLTGLARPLRVMKLPQPFRQVRSWEINRRVYGVLGVHMFGTLLRRTPLRFLNSTVYLNGRPGDTEGVCAQVQAAEAAHYWAPIVTIPYVVFLVLQVRWNTFLWFILINVGTNVYPVLHLRSARGRLIRARDRKLLIRSRRSPS